MNAQGKQRKFKLEDVLASSSETARQALRKQGEAKIQSDLNSDVESGAEMTPPTIRISTCVSE